MYIYIYLWYTYIYYSVCIRIYVIHMHVDMCIPLTTKTIILVGCLYINSIWGFIIGTYKNDGFGSQWYIYIYYIYISIYITAHVDVRLSGY